MSVQHSQQYCFGCQFCIIPHCFTTFKYPCYQFTYYHFSLYLATCSCSDNKLQIYTSPVDTHFEIFAEYFNKKLCFCYNLCKSMQLLDLTQKFLNNLAAAKFDTILLCDIWQYPIGNCFPLTLYASVHYTMLYATVLLPWLPHQKWNSNYCSTVP